MFNKKSVLIFEGKECTQCEIRLWDVVPCNGPSFLRSVPRTIYVVNMYTWEAMVFMHIIKLIAFMKFTTLGNAPSL